MALIVDESFLTGIPPSFATARQQFGTLVVTYNAGAQAVDLSDTTLGNCIWDLTSVPLSVSGEMEIDLEFVSDYSGANNYQAGGVWAVAGQAAISNGVLFRHLATNYDLYTWTGATSWSGNSAITSFDQRGTFPFATAGDRRTFNLRWDMSAGAGINRLAAECRIDGNLIHSSQITYPSLRPGVHLYAAAVRLHSIKVWDAPQIALTPLGTHGFTPAVARGIYAPPEALSGAAPQKISRGAVIGRQNTYYSGPGTIVGTVKEAGSPDAPVIRKVRLHLKSNGALIQETWSDAVGNYTFANLMVQPYYVTSFDHTGNYNAVIKDSIVPEVL